MPGAPKAARGRTREIARALLFGAALVGILAGPGRLGGTTTRSPLRGWAMYGDLAIGLVDARWVQVAGGREAPLEPAAVLAGGAQGAAGRRLVGRGPFLGLGRQLCRALGPGAEVRAYARIATPRGWEVLEAGERDHCGRGPAGAGAGP